MLRWRGPGGRLPWLSSSALSTVFPPRRRAAPFCDTRDVVTRTGFPASRVRSVQTTSEDEAMEPRFNMFGNELGAKFAKRFANTSMVIANSPLPKSTQELMGLGASQNNSRGWGGGHPHTE